MTPAATANVLTPAGIIDLDRYPIDRLDGSEGRAMLDAIRADLRARGACQLPGFLRQEAVDRLVTEATGKRDIAYRTDDVHNVYFEAIDETRPEHALLQHSSKNAIAWDRIDPDSPVRIAYEWDALTTFVGEAFGLPACHRDEDPLGACSLMLFEEGDELGWHFDRAHFVVTLMLQGARHGGEFEFFPNLRTEQDENHEGVRERLTGSRDGVITLVNEPGTLSLFRGHYSMHRVTPVKGGRTRVNAVLAYAEKPGRKLNDLTQKLFYGRTA
ncbi:hypothetical protein GCM10022226_20170 [Sphaerisporangium flaviroseum]|uniref:Fe2OG dioxygenase domain-containing protein n=1 Tax=Sphaerisporangium flaviroseum TaxID=509199 RepID=A0ABP7HRP4_9ACTN